MESYKAFCVGLALVGAMLSAFQGKKQSKIFATGKCAILKREARFIILHARFSDAVGKRVQGKYGK